VGALLRRHSGLIPNTSEAGDYRQNREDSSME
jgi:hypothetical protein